MHTRNPSTSVPLTVRGFLVVGDFMGEHRENRGHLFWLSKSRRVNIYNYNLARKRRVPLNIARVFLHRPAPPHRSKQKPLHLHHAKGVVYRFVYVLFVCRVLWHVIF